jgi:ABC-type multidrug transport system fused ATPase/permease subunit
VEDGCFKWELDLELLALNHINIKIEKGSFVGIVGMVGSGKFTIPASLLGEVPRITGRVWSLELLL